MLNGCSSTNYHAVVLLFNGICIELIHSLCVCVFLVAQGLHHTIKIADHFTVCVYFGRDSTKQPIKINLFENCAFRRKPMVYGHGHSHSHAVINIFMLMHFIYVWFFCLHLSPLHNTYCSFCLVFLFILLDSFAFARSCEFPITLFAPSAFSHIRWGLFLFR